jgi:hypothetical protein
MKTSATVTCLCRAMRYRQGYWSRKEGCAQPDILPEPNLGTILYYESSKTNRIVATLVKILELTFRRQIGWYCWIRETSYVFGINVMTPKFKLKIDRSPTYEPWNIVIKSSLITSQNF